MDIEVVLAAARVLQSATFRDEAQQVLEEAIPRFFVVSQRKRLRFNHLVRCGEPFASAMPQHAHVAVLFDRSSVGSGSCSGCIVHSRQTCPLATRATAMMTSAASRRTYGCPTRE